MKPNNLPSAPVVQLLSDLIPEPIVDIVSGVTYKGFAPLGTAENEAGWLITRTKTTGTVTKVEYAQGVMDYSSKWSDRATYDYSR